MRRSSRVLASRRRSTQANDSKPTRPIAIGRRGVALQQHGHLVGGGADVGAQLVAEQRGDPFLHRALAAALLRFAAQHERQRREAELGDAGAERRAVLDPRVARRRRRHQHLGDELVLRRIAEQAARARR